MPSKVLIVDDTEAFAKLIAAALDGHDQFVCVGSASSGADARRAAADLSPDIILLDVWLTDGSSLHVLPNLARENPSCCVIVMTGDPSEQLRRRVLERGAGEFFDKTQGMPALIALLNSVAGNRR